MKASQILEQLSQHKDEMHKKKAVLAFERCNACGGELKFIHSLDYQNARIVENGQCERCLQNIQARSFSLN